MLYSDDFVKLCKSFEGLHLEAYICPAGVPTIGWGSTFNYSTNRKVRLGDRITEQEANKFFVLEVDSRIASKAQAIPAWPKLNQSQRDALIDFMYNLGANFYESPGFETITYCLKNFSKEIAPLRTLLDLPEEKVLGAASLPKLSPSDRGTGEELVPYALLLYRNPGTDYEDGLLRRRIAEANLWKQNKTKSFTMKSVTDTFLKKEPIQSTELKSDQLVDIPLDKTYRVKSVLRENINGHHQVELDYGAGIWYLYAPHWEPWAQSYPPSNTDSDFPSYEEIDWLDFSQKMGPYFTLGEYYMHDSRRVAKSEDVRRNSYAILYELHKIRKEWGSPIRITSGYRPKAINAAVGGVSNSRHVAGDAVDIADAHGQTTQLEKFIDSNWTGALGYGSRYRGFVHIDCRHGKGWKTPGAAGPRWKY